MDRYRTTSEADQGVIQPFAVTEVKFTNSRTSDDKDRPVKPFPANTTTTGSDPGAISGPAQTEQVDDQSEKPENRIGLRVLPKTGDETPILRDILILAAARGGAGRASDFQEKEKEVTQFLKKETAGDWKSAVFLLYLNNKTVTTRQLRQQKDR